VADLPRLPNQRVTTELAGWLARKIQVPTVFDAPRLPPSRMPTFPHLEPQEAQAMGIALASLHGKGPPEPWIRHHDPAPAPVPPGETGRLVQRYRCLVCHQLGGQGGSVAHIPLDGAGARLRRPWLDRFLQAPVTVRMDQPERMPVLGITPEEARQLADWIAGSLGDDRVLLAEVPTPTTEGPVLYTRYGCGACHVAAGGGTMKGPTLDGAGHRLQPGYVLALLRDPTVVPEHRHPGPRLPDAEARTLAAYVLALPGVLPWPDAPHRTGDPSP
jgi:mono/diheme cytochrome c family protein